MKKKIILVSLFLLILLLKPYININYSNDTLNDNIIGSYTLGYPNCSYTDSYAEYSSSKHYAYCWCGRYTTA